MLLECGIVDENVQPSELIDRALDRLLAKLRVRNITGEDEAAPAFLLDSALRVLCVLAMATSAPSRAKRTATDRPIPESPPVMSATIPFSFSEPL
jgi:hypothetical protein